MKIVVDADACPVKEIILKTAQKYDIKVIMVTDTSHIMYDMPCDCLLYTSLTIQFFTEIKIF